jgi:prefoldin subunit 5
MEIELEQFLEKMVEIINKRIENQEKTIREIQKEINSLKKKGVDSSVLKVLEGK